MAEVYPAPTPPAPKKKRSWLLIGCGSIVGLLVVCGVISQLLPGGGNTTTAQPTAAVAAGAAESTEAGSSEVSPPTEVPATVAADEPAPTEGPTNTPEPTGTPEPTATPEPTPEPTAAPVGKSRESAAPVGQGVQSENGWEVKVTGIERNATGTIKAANQFNDDPLPGNEWVLVSLAATYNGENNETQKLTGTEFRLTGSRGTIYTTAFVAIDNQFEGEVFKGGTIEGVRPFQVPEGETNLIVIFAPGFGNEAVYLATAELIPPIVPPVEPEGVADAGQSKDAPATGPVLAENGVQIKVLEVVRNATARIKEENQFNDDPIPGNEYVMVRIESRYFGDDTTRRDPASMYRLVGEKNVIYENQYMAVKAPYEGEVYKYGVIDGWLVFQVAEGEQNLVVIYSGGGIEAKFIALPAQ